MGSHCTTANKILLGVDNLQWLSFFIMATFILIIITLIIGLFLIALRNRPKFSRISPIYNYKAKEHLMTSSEEVFFKMLSEAMGLSFYIFPQVHLSSIIDHKVNGQNWKYSFRHINGKSVDFVLCDKITLKPTFAVELDDYTHSFNGRIKRDKEVARMLKSASVPLIRFSDYKSLSVTDISKRFITS